MSIVSQLHEELEGLRRDAERYRWLRDPKHEKILVLDNRVGDCVECLDHLSLGEMDEAVDSLMAGEVSQ